MVSSSKVRQAASADFPARWGHFLIRGFATRAAASLDGAKTEEVVALVMGEKKCLDEIDLEPYRLAVLFSVHNAVGAGAIESTLAKPVGAQSSRDNAV
jgi:hypothetical protein